MSFGFVSAYLLVKDGVAVLVDTGVSGGAGEIERSLSELGLGWGSVGHVILTHLHPDHVGGLGDVMSNASEAIGYAGAKDITGITSPRPLTAVGDGDVVFGLDIIETPGHTPGHVSVLDPIGSVLIAGDAINGEGGGVVGPNPQFSQDMGIANASVVKVAGLTFNTAVFGHGEPVAEGASSLVVDLAAGL